MAEGGWFDAAHEQAVRDAAATGDPGERLRSVKTLLAEETRLGMLVGVAVGFELSRALDQPDAHDQTDAPDQPDPLDRPDSDNQQED